VRLLARVGEEVAGQVGGPGKGLVTLGFDALVRLLARVGEEVAGQVGGPGKGLVTLGALVRLLLLCFFHCTQGIIMGTDK
jgi:hypothetical protein